MDEFIKGYQERKNRYIQYDRIDSIIESAINSGLYNNTIKLDRLDSECKQAFIVRFGNTPIVFDSVSQFEKFLLS